MTVSRSLMVLAGLSVLAGCSFATQDGAQSQAPFKLAESDQGCLAGAVRTIEDYFSEAVTSAQVEQAWDCASNALKMFDSHTRGSSADSYSSEELRSFIQRHFLGDLVVSDQLLSEIMRLKQTILGGEIDRMTRSELSQAQELLRVLKAETLRMRLHIHVITLETPIEDVQKNPRVLEAAIAEMDRSMNVLGGLFAQAQQNYRIENLENLLREFQKLYAGRSEWKGPEWAIHHLSTVQALKNLIMRPNGSVVEPSEWKELLLKAGHLYSLYLRVHYLMSDRDLLSGEGLDHLSFAVGEAFKLLEGAIDAKPEKRIDYGTINVMVDELYRLKILTWKISATTLKNLIPVILEKVFGRNHSPVGGLDRARLNEFRTGVLAWLERQHLWREMSAKISPSRAGGGYVLSAVRAGWSSLQGHDQGFLRDLRSALERVFPVTYTPEGVVVFKREPDEHVLDQAGFDSLNWKVAFIRGVVQGYSSDPEANRYRGLSKDEFKEFFADARQLGVELGFLDPTDDMLWLSTFEEINLFALSGNGDEWLDFQEGLDLISYAMSSSFLAKRTTGDLVSSCAHHEPDVFGIPKVEAWCFRMRLRAKFSSHYSLLPPWAKLRESLSWSEIEGFERALEQASRRNGYSNDLVESSDIDRMTMVLQILESVFVRFDRNRDDRLDFAEVRGLFPLLRPLLQEASGFNDEERLLALFAYILQYGEPPASLVDKIFFQFLWKDDEPRWQRIFVDRFQLLKIIGQLREAS